MENTPAAIAMQAQELASAAYDATVRRERDECFRRAMPAQGYESVAQATFSMKREKEVAGRYALCLQLGSKLVPVTGTLLDTLDGANAARLERSEPNL